jgi:hypothetical protein
MSNTGFIYFIRAVGSEPTRYKIGLTNNLERRVKELNRGQSAFPNEMLWNVAVNDTENAESDLHNRFVHHRVHGEWFQFDDDMLDEVRDAFLEVAQNYPNKPKLKKAVPQTHTIERNLSQVSDIEKFYNEPVGDNLFRKLLEVLVLGAAITTIGPILLNTQVKASDPISSNKIELPTVDVKMPSLPGWPNLPKIELPKISNPFSPTLRNAIVLGPGKVNVREFPNGKIIRTINTGTTIQISGDREAEWLSYRDGYIHRSMLNQN